MVLEAEKSVFNYVCGNNLNSQLLYLVCVVKLNSQLLYLVCVEKLNSQLYICSEGLNSLLYQGRIVYTSLVIHMFIKLNCVCAFVMFILMPFPVFYGLQFSMEACFKHELFFLQRV